jgi:hypothetical protein
MPPAVCHNAALAKDEGTPAVFCPRCLVVIRVRRLFLCVRNRGESPPVDPEIGEIREDTAVGKTGRRNPDSPGFALTSAGSLYTVCVASGPVCAPSGPGSSPILIQRRK